MLLIIILSKISKSLLEQSWKNTKQHCNLLTAAIGRGPLVRFPAGRILTLILSTLLSAFGIWKRFSSIEGKSIVTMKLFWLSYGGSLLPGRSCSADLPAGLWLTLMSLEGRSEGDDMTSTFSHGLEVVGPVTGPVVVGPAVVGPAVVGPAVVGPAVVGPAMVVPVMVGPAMVDTGGLGVSLGVGAVVCVRPGVTFSAIIGYRN